MKALLKILNIFFVVLGVIFFILIIGLGYIWVTDPFNLKPMISSGMSPISVIKTVTGNNEVEIDNIDKNPLLTEEQEAQLESIVIDPASLPSEITPEMEKCFIEKLGEERTNEIMQGDSPNTMDYLKANSCLN
ncbi:MAG: hypothetical protein COT81_05845 [Candidatus Buchananbacteria bacterium CG10_big_fil_rev_8_21_14_0_10_42_9]|uniref:Uncharacterized protein n=1 Tax=Candidatus Buchananbacteria bacterium CG10_big_fil_rev_8_21_14_0_10_42_9 TaxID=1974526 RepID=A0A2H0W265_9BACT|nr:MAG: hypothetical protein COT81_05845 [Candidatus Buchananbacteria bacterium CG10_big_fil_rev_8_21_14_0_10_42_9]